MRLRSFALAASALTMAFAGVGGFVGTASAVMTTPIAGYWSVDAAGRVVSNGDALDLGDLRGVHLNAPIVGIATTSIGRGYWLVAADGGVFTFGDARFFGSAGNLHLNAPVVGIAASRFGRGYRLAASDGGVFTYGDATFSGAARGYPTTAIATSPFGGYVLQSSGGGWLSAFGNASSCRTDAIVQPRPDPTRPSFVGVAAAFAATSADPEGGMATVHCPYLGGATGAFRAPAHWRVQVSEGDSLCFTQVFALDRVGSRPVPTRALVAESGSIQMRSTQMAGHSVFDVHVLGTDCRMVATNSSFTVFGPPFTTSTPGDTPPFAGPFTLQAHGGTCTTEVRASDDGRLVQTKTGSSYTMHVPAGFYWVSNSRRCTIAVS